MTDIPQELVERVAEAFWNEGRDKTNWSYAEMVQYASDPDADVPRDSLEWVRGKARAAIAAMLDGVTLEWESLDDDDHWRAAAPLFGSIRVERYGRDGWAVNWTAPGYSATFTPGEWPSSDEAKAAALADYRQRMLKAMIGGS